VLGQENRALRETAARALALEREREALLRLLSFGALVALLMIVALIYLVSR